MGIRKIVETMPHMRSLSTGDSLGPWPVIETVPGSPVTVLEFPDGTNPEEIDNYLKELEARHLIREVDGELGRDVKTGYKPLGIIAPLVDPEFAPGDTFPIVGVGSETQQRGKWGAGVRIGHCDTGCNFGHPWFAGKDLTGDSGDSVGHGTFCAGIMVGSQGIASDASLLERNVLPGGTGDEVGVSRGIRECAEAGCQVINLSLGGTSSSLIDAACQYASQLGAIVVAAAGNTSGATIGSPARASDVIVLAIDRDHKYATFTSGTNWSNANRTAAPGVDDVSAAVSGGVTQGSGTSFSAPHVTAMLALLRASGLSRADALTYLWAHRTAAPDKLTPVMVDDFGSVEPVPGDPDWLDAARELIDIGHGLVSAAQAARCGWDATYDEYRASMVEIMDHQLGPISDVFDQLEATLPKAEPVPEPPPPPPASQFALPIGDGAVYGKTKWLVGSLGCDMFVKRGTPVYSPDDCIVEEVIPGVGASGGAEIIVSKPDHSWAWRYRHVQATVRLNDRVSRGQMVATVFDESMDWLGHTPPGFPAPDNYQHLDLSVAKGTNQFSPQGGGGGNYNSYTWLQEQGYKGTVVARTPGPNDASRLAGDFDEPAHTPTRAPGSEIKGSAAQSGSPPKNRGGLHGPGEPSNPGARSCSRAERKTRAPTFQRMFLAPTATTEPAWPPSPPDPRRYTRRKPT